MRTSLNKKERLLLKRALFTSEGAFTANTASAIRELCGKSIRWSYAKDSPKYSKYKRAPGFGELKLILTYLNIKHIGGNTPKITDKRFLELTSYKETYLEGEWVSAYTLVEDLLIAVIKCPKLKAVLDRSRGKGE